MVLKSHTSMLTSTEVDVGVPLPDSALSSQLRRIFLPEFVPKTTRL